MWLEFLKAVDPKAEFLLGVDQSQLVLLEKTLNTPLPDELKSLLMETDGVRDEFGSWLMWPVKLIEQNNIKMRRNPEFRENYMPFTSFLFFADAGNGDKFAFRVIQGAIKRPDIFVWNHEDDSRTWAAPSLKVFLEWWISGKLNI